MAIAPKIGIVYVPFKNTRHFAQVVESWRNLAYDKNQIVIYIVPNSDPEGMLPEVERVAREAAALGLPQVRVLADGINHGFAGNHNKGIAQALYDGCEFVYLNNGDLHLHADALTEAVQVMQTDERIGVAQSLMLYWHEPEKINVAGGVVHIAGYGYAMHNGDSLASTSLKDGADIGYASAGAALYRANALREVGLLEEGFFMYHEDLELGLRLWVAGWRNVLATKSLAYHDYVFAINARMFEWMEAYRYMVLLAYLRPFTLILLAPIWLGVELATWAFALRGGWVKAKLGAWRTLLSPKSWKLVLSMRARMKRLRRTGDRALLRFMTGRIEAQEQSNWIVEKIANPALDLYARFLKAIVIW